ncbi:MAG: hypothetical protein SNF33_06035 [Candidatus Algichlamydia australiensis]|nr:hypothetical protein [Chlamydiales bacterium]
MKKITIILLILLTACNSRANHVATFQIKTDANTNEGIPFYVVAKSTEYMEYVCDDYHKIYNELASASDEDERIVTFFIIPGETKKIRVEGKGNKAPAIYFLFTKPGEAWSYYASGGGKQSVKLFLGKHEIEAQSAFRS